MGFSRQFIKEHSRYLLPNKYLKQLIKEERKMAHFESMSLDEQEKHKKEIRVTKQIIRAINAMANSEYDYEYQVQNFINTLESEPIFGDGISDLCELVDVIKKYNINSIDELIARLDASNHNRVSNSPISSSKIPNTTSTLSDDTKEMRWKMIQVALVNPHIEPDWTVRKIFSSVNIGVSYDGLLYFIKKYGNELSQKYGKLPYNELIKAKILLEYMENPYVNKQNITKESIIEPQNKPDVLFKTSDFDKTDEPEFYPDEDDEDIIPFH